MKITVVAVPSIQICGQPITGDSDTHLVHNKPLLLLTDKQIEGNVVTLLGQGRAAG